MSKRSWSSFGIWTIIVAVVWVIAWIIAEAIPVFNDLLSLISALFASWFTYGLSGVFWLYLNRGQYTRSKRKIFLTGINVGCLLVGAVIVGLSEFWGMRPLSTDSYLQCGLGLYSAGTAINKSATSSKGSFSCNDNSRHSS